MGNNEINPEEWHYSLCQVLDNNKSNYTRLLRLADYLGVTDERKIQKNEGRTLQPSAYWENPEYILLNKYKDAYGNPNELGIWRWQIDSPEKTISFVVGDTRFIEFLPVYSWQARQDFDSLVSIIDRLLSGIDKSPEINIRPPFLLGIGLNNDHYICLYVENNACKLDQTRLQLIEGKEYKIYSISKSDIIDSDESFSKLKNNDKYQYQNKFHPRTIYRRYPLTIASIGTIELHNAAYYIEKHLQEIIDNLKCSDEIRGEIKRIISSGAQDEDGFKVLVNKFVNADADLFLNSYVEQNKTYLSKITDRFNDEDSGKQFITNLVEGTPELKKKYMDYLIENYLADKKAEIQKAVDELEVQKKTIEGELTQINKDIHSRKSEIAGLEIENATLTASNTSLKNQLEGSAHDLLESLSIVRDVLGIGCVTSSRDKVSKEITVSSGTQQLFMRPKASTDNMDEITTLTTYEDVIDTLEGNLDEIYENNAVLGLKQDEKESYAHLIAGSYLYNIPLLCFGHSAQRLAQVISLTLCAETADVLCVPSGFNDYARLLSAINSIDSKYVILENLVGYSEEYCYLHLPVDVPEKHFIYVSEFTDNLKLLPAEIYSSMICLDCNKLSKSSKSLEYGKVEDVSTLKNSKLVPSDRFEILRKVSKLLKLSPLASGYISLRMPLLEIFANADKISSVAKLYYELKAILNIIGYSDEYRERLDTEKDKLISDFNKILSE